MLRAHGCEGKWVAACRENQKLSSGGVCGLQVAKPPHHRCKPCVVQLFEGAAREDLEATKFELSGTPQPHRCGCSVLAGMPHAAGKLDWTGEEETRRPFQAYAQHVQEVPVCVRTTRH